MALPNFVEFAVSKILNNLWWCRARDLFGSQILVTTEGFELQISCITSSYLTHLWPRGLGNYFVCKRFEVQTLLCSLEFVIQINLKHDTIAVWNVARSSSISSSNNLVFMHNSWNSNNCWRIQNFENYWRDLTFTLIVLSESIIYVA